MEGRQNGNGEVAVVWIANNFGRRRDERSRSRVGSGRRCTQESRGSRGGSKDLVLRVQGGREDWNEQGR